VIIAMAADYVTNVDQFATAASIYVAKILYDHGQHFNNVP